MRATRFWAQQFLSRGVLVPGPVSRQTAPALRSFFTAAYSSARPSVNGSPQRWIPRASRFSRPARSLRWKSDKPSSGPAPNPTEQLGSPQPLSLSQRMKKLSREYGWSALGVYFLLTALDFPFCFLAVRALGTDRIAHYEHIVLEAASNVIRVVYPDFRKARGTVAVSDVETTAEATSREGDFGLSEVDLADAANNGSEASIWTQLALAYAIHKAFIFVRIPATVAVTPKVVKTLRGWGWDIGKRKPKSK